MFSFLPVVYIIVVVECLAGLQVVDELLVLGRLRPFLSLPRLLFPLFRMFPLQVISETVLNTLSPVPVTIFPISVVLHPVPPALPHLGAGAGDGASQGGIRATQMSRHVRCERVMLSACQS